MKIGTLYIVATPIGNLEDMTPRAVRILSEVDVIAAEDTRHSRKLLNFFGIKTPLISCHEFNEEKKGDFIVSKILDGEDIALISDAGTPCISDPGYKLVKMAADTGVNVVPICGVSAVTAALSVSGFNISSFTFLGFLPRGKELKKFVENISYESIIVFYESPKRIKETIKIFADSFPDTEICLCNDITKKFEKIYRGTFSEVQNYISINENVEKGEYTCVVKFVKIEEAKNNKEAVSYQALLLDTMIKNDCNLKDAAKLFHEKNRSVSKKEIYSAMLSLKKFALQTFHNQS